MFMRSSNIGQMGGFRIGMPAQVYEFAAHANSGSPSSGLFIEANTLVWSTMRKVSLVGDILRSGCFSQVVPAIVRSIAVSVINVSLRPSASHVNEGNHRGRKFALIDLQAPSAISARSSCVRPSAAPASFDADLPEKQSGSRIVLEKLSNALGSRSHGHLLSDHRFLTAVGAY